MIKNIIFDFDGVLVDSEILVAKAFAEYMLKYGIEIDLRDNLNGEIYISHDPFKNGENLDTFLNFYNHSFIILNIK